MVWYRSASAVGLRGPAHLGAQLSAALLNSSVFARCRHVQPEEGAARAAQFILHASLDMVDMNTWATTANYLKVVDRHNEQMVSAYVTAGGLKFLILHDTRNEENIKTFCQAVNELYVKLLLNPFYTANTRIENKDFDVKVRALARRYLGYRGE